MIRPATPADWPEIERMLLAFNAAAGIYADGYSAAHLRATVTALIASPRGLVALATVDDGAPVGVLIAEAGRSPFVPRLVAQELILWIDPAARGSAHLLRGLLRGFEDWADAIGAADRALSAFDDRTGDLFARMGYRAADRRWIRAA